MQATGIQPPFPLMQYMELATIPHKNNIYFFSAIPSMSMSIYYGAKDGKITTPCTQNVFRLFVPKVIYIY